MNFSALGAKEKATFINVFENKFEVEIDGPRPELKNYISRVNKLERTIHALHFDTLGIFITNVSVDQHESYGYQLRIRGARDGEDYLLTLGMSGLGASLAKQLPMIDFTKMVTLEIYLNKTTQRGGISAKQLDPITGKLEWVTNKWTKEAPGDLPAWEQIIVKGVQQWDNSKEVLFLKEYTNTVVAAAVTSAAGAQPVAAPAPAPAPTPTPASVQTHTQAAQAPTSHEAMNELAAPVVHAPEDINPEDIPF